MALEEMGINAPPEAKEALKQPSEEMQLVLMARLAEMTKEELAMLDSAITPSVAKILMKLLPELEMLIEAVKGEGEMPEKEMDDGKPEMDMDMDKDMGALGNVG